MRPGSARQTVSGEGEQCDDLRMAASVQRFAGNLKQKHEYCELAQARHRASTTVDEPFALSGDNGSSISQC